MSIIKEFQGQHRWLSNFWPVAIMFRGIMYPSSENAYQSTKSDSPEWKSFCSNPLTRPGATKKASRKYTLTSEFHDNKVAVMAEIQGIKFQDPDLRARLLATGDSLILEGNKWGDEFWGVTWNEDKSCTGKNHLGEIIMRVRKKIQDEERSE